MSVSTEKSLGASPLMWGDGAHWRVSWNDDLYDLIIFFISKNARIKNWGSFEAYHHCSGILPTGLIAGLFGTYFPIAALWASNQE
jgi:hypothetical protein